MNFVLIPSLQHMALVKITGSLWNQIDVRKSILESGSWTLKNVWPKIENTVAKKVPKFPIPKLLKEKVLNLIEPIGREVLQWILFSFANYRLPFYLPAELCWSLQGTLDRKRTTESLVQDENIDICTRYKLACIFCLEDYIEEFWNVLADDMKKKFSYEDMYKPDNELIISYWSQYMKRKEQGCAVQSNYNSEFLQAIYCGNITATQYFLQKLNPEEKNYSLIEAGWSATGDILHFVLSEMNEEQRMELFKDRPYDVLSSFIKWPLQSFFLGIANLILEFFSVADYDKLLNIIAYKFADGDKDWNYPKLFREFWHESPKTLKSLFLDEIDNCSLLWTLFDMKDEENIRLICMDVPPAEKKKFIENYEMNIYWDNAIYNDDWDFLNFVLLEFFPSKTEKLKFKEQFEKRYQVAYPSVKKHFEANKEKWNNLFQVS